MNSGLPQTVKCLAHKAADRTHQAFRPATQASYLRKFRVFVAYCCFIKMQLRDITAVVALSFLEFLTENAVSHTSIANYISAIKATLSLHGLPTVAFLDPRIAYFQRSLTLNKPYAPTLKKIIDIPLLQAITVSCDTMWMGQIFKALYLTAFFFHF